MKTMNTERYLMFSDDQWFVYDFCSWIYSIWANKTGLNEIWHGMAWACNAYKQMWCSFEFTICLSASESIAFDIPSNDMKWMDETEWIMDSFKSINNWPIRCKREERKKQRQEIKKAKTERDTIKDWKRMKQIDLWFSNRSRMVSNGYYSMIPVTHHQHNF